MGVISFDELKEKGKLVQEGLIVDIPDWINPSEKVQVRVRLGDVVEMISNDIDPSNLTALVQEEFEGKNNSEMSDTEFQEMLPKLKSYATELLLEPTKEQLEEAGLELNFTQATAIINKIMGVEDEIKK